MSEDPRLNAARYRVARAASEDAPAETAEKGRRDGAVAAEASPSAAPARTAHERALYVDTAIQQAIRRGEFDDLPGAGKLLEGLGDHHDPDWWIRRKIQSEQLTGLGPPALMLRGEHAEFTDRVDALTRESEVREYVDGFNRRVIEARRQLQGGPPVVTPTRDAETEVVAWRERRDVRDAHAADAPDTESAHPAGPARRSVWRRRARP